MPLFSTQTKHKNFIRHKNINISQKERTELCETRNYDWNIALAKGIQGVNFPFW
jgi:hypothetical protein